MEAVHEEINMVITIVKYSLSFLSSPVAPSTTAKTFPFPKGSSLSDLVLLCTIKHSSSSCWIFFCPPKLTVAYNIAIPASEHRGVTMASVLRSWRHFVVVTGFTARQYSCSSSTRLLVNSSLLCIIFCLYNVR